MELENLANHVSITAAGEKEVSYVKEHSEVAFKCNFLLLYRNDKR